MRLAHTALATLFILSLWTTSVEAAVCNSGQACLCTSGSCSSLAWDSRLSCCLDSCGGPISNNNGFACASCDSVEHAISCEGGRVTECESGYTPSENTCQPIGCAESQLVNSANAWGEWSGLEPSDFVAGFGVGPFASSSGNDFQKVFSLEPHTSLTLVLQWWRCGTMDYYPLDSFTVDVDSFSESFDSHRGDVVGPASFTWCPNLPTSHQGVQHRKTITIASHTAPTATIRIRNNVDQGLNDEAYLLESLTVTPCGMACDPTTEVLNTDTQTCVCAPGYWDNAGTCEEVDACAADGCGAAASCEDLPPPAEGGKAGRACTCNAGYGNHDDSAPEGTPAAGCTEIDACVNFPCGADATCVDVAAPALDDAEGRSCACNAGFFGDGESCSQCPDGQTSEAGAAGCTEIDACVNFPCGADATCVDVAAPALDDAEGRSCACNAGFFGDGESCSQCPDGWTSEAGATECAPPPGAISESYGVAVESEFGGCPAEIGGSANCWHITMSLSGSLPQHSERALYLYGAAGVDPIRFPCSLADTKCTCLDSMIADYVATTLEASACSGGSFNAAAYPAALTSMYNAEGVEYNDIHVSVSPDNTTYTLVVAATAMERIPQAVTEIDGGFRWELHVGFAELLPVGDLDYFDVVPHETTVLLEQTFFASYSSVSAQKATSLQFANARVHKVHDTTADQYYVAVSFVVDGGNVTGVNIPTSSIVVEAGGNAIDVACAAGGAFSGQAAAFSRSCGPFPDDDTPPFCSGTLHVSGGSGLASLFVPLNEMPSEDSLRLEFVISTSGVDAPTLETVAVTVNNLGASGGFVEWCEDAVSDLVDFVTDSALDVGMYAGVVLPEDAGLMSLASLGSVADDTQVPVPRATIMDGVISVAVNYSSGFDAEVVKLAAVYVEGADAGESVISNYLTRIPVAEYDPATGVVSMNTDDLCVDDAGACEVKVLDVDGGSTPECLALKAESVDNQDAGNWLRDVAGTSNPFIAEVGQHFYAQFADFKEAYWINPRKDTTATAVSVGSTIPATTVAVFALVRVSASAAERRSSRYLLQSVGAGSDSLASGAVRLEVSAASLAASVLGVSPELVTTWSVQMSISAAEECLPDQELIKLARARLLAALANAASELVDVQVTSVKLDAAEVNCPPRGRRLLAASSPTMEVEALIIFADDGSKPFVDVAKLEATPGIKTVTQTDNSPIVTVVESPPAHAEEQHPEPLKTQTASNSMMVIVASAAGVVAVVAVGVALLVWRRTAAKSEDAVLLSAAAVHGSFSKGAKMEQVLGDVTCTLEVDTDGDSATRCSSVRMVESRA